MNRNHRLGWLVRVSSAAILTLGLVGCGDDGDGDGDAVDAATPDAVPCVGHACPGEDGVELLPEGGMLRLEYLHVGNDPQTGDRVEAPLRAFMLAFEGQEFYDGDAQKPRPFLGPLVASTPTMNCFDQGANNLFFNAHHPSLQDIADTRTYYTDLPASIDLTARNAGTVIPLTNLPDERDPADGLLHDQMFLGSGPASEITRGDYHDVAPIAPTSDFPGLALQTGYDIPGGGGEWDGQAGAYIAPDFDLIQPTEDVFYTQPNFYIDPSQPMTMEYALVDNGTIPDGTPTPVWFAGFASLQDYGNGAGPRPTVTHLCLGEVSRANGNTVELPADLFTQPNFPESGAMITGLITHTAWANNETHRFDVVAMNCDLGRYTTAAPAP